jgi:hypothetical protein
LLKIIYDYREIMGLLVRSEYGFLFAHTKFFSTAETVKIIGFCFSFEPILCEHYFHHLTICKKQIHLLHLAGQTEPSMVNYRHLTKYYRKFDTVSSDGLCAGNYLFLFKGI